MSTRWEEQLFEAIHEGDAVAFERIFDLYKERVRLVTWRISHRPDWIEDIVNEAWCRAFAQRTRFEPGQSFLVWMVGIVRNVYREECRKSPLVIADDSAPGGNVPSTETSPDDLAEEAELLAALNGCLEKLAEQDREIVRLRFFEGQTLRAVSDSLGIPESTLRDVRIKAAFKIIRKCLQSKGIRDSQNFPAQESPEVQ